MIRSLTTKCLECLPQVSWALATCLWLVSAGSFLQAQTIDDFEGAKDTAFNGKWLAWGDSELRQAATGLIGPGYDSDTSRRLVQKKGQWWGVVAQKVFDSVVDISDYASLQFWWRSDYDDAVRSLDVNLVFANAAGAEVIYSLKESLEPKLQQGFASWTLLTIPLVETHFDVELRGDFDLTRLQRLEILIRNNGAPANEKRTVYFDNLTLREATAAPTATESDEVRVYVAEAVDNNRLDGDEAYPAPKELHMDALYRDWAARFPNAELSDPEADYDLDGCSNRKEWLFATDPTDAEACEPIILTLDEGLGAFTYTRRAQMGDRLTYSIWFTRNMQVEDWAEDKAAMQEVEATNAADVETVQVALGPTVLVDAGVYVQVRAHIR